MYCREFISQEDRNFVDFFKLLLIVAVAAVGVFYYNHASEHV